nr:hypothetical protein [uncultured Lichenicoccus sp.]
MHGMTYQWRQGARFSVDPQYAGEEIETLRKRANGQLTPAQVVDAARNEASVLHPAFEWDDSIAAERHREDQARYLVGALVVKVAPKGVQREVRAFVSVQQAETTGYTSLGAAMSDAELRRQVLARAWQELQAWRARYAAYSELAEIHAVIDEKRQKLG